MSQENVEIVRRLYEEFERGNFWVAELFDPDIRIEWTDPMFARSAESEGLAGLTSDMREFFEAWEHVTATAEQIIDAGERVVVIAVWRGLGKGSGVETETRQGLVWTLRDGRVISVVAYSDPARALEAAGLAE
jgi:ketosteroid isomerase-like protein